jgi:hypothetical protein
VRLCLYIVASRASQQCQGQSVCQGRTGILVAGRSLLMVIVAQSVGDARCQLDCLVPGASAGLLLIDCALLFAACLSLPLQ